MIRPERRGWALSFAALAFAAALVPRMYVALFLAKEAVWDGQYYAFGARRIAAGFGYSDSLSVAGELAGWHPWCHYPVGYSAFLGLFYWLFGSGHLTTGIVNATVGASLAPLTYVVAARGLAAERAKLAAMLVAVHPGLILYSGLVMSEELAAATTLLAFAVALSGRQRGRAPIVGALFLGLAALVRPQALLCAPFLVFAPSRARRSRTLSLALGAGLLSLVALLPVLPWTARNCRVMDGCALVSTNAGWNLAIGAFPRATGRFEQITSDDGCRVVTGQVQQDRCWLGVGLKAIKDDPKRYLSLVPKKLGFTFDHESFPVEYLHQADPEGWPDALRGHARDVASTFHRWLLVLAAAATIRWPFGLHRGAARSMVALVALSAAAAWSFAGTPTFWPLAVAAGVVPFFAREAGALRLSAALLLTTAATHAVFFGEDRYHLVASPALCLLAAAAFRAQPLRRD